MPACTPIRTCPCQAITSTEATVIEERQADTWYGHAVGKKTSQCKQLLCCVAKNTDLCCSQKFN